MRSVVLIDLKIDKDEALTLLDEFSKIFLKYTGIEHTYWLERRDFSEVPTVVMSDGDMKPTHEYRTNLNNEIHSRYNDFGTDNVVMWVHEDNFLYKGIWGQAWAYVYKKHSFLLCRWDKDNSINTLYTLLHEMLHPLDKVISEELGIDINPLIKEFLLKSASKEDARYIQTNGYDYDRDYVHGTLPSAHYIGRSGYSISDESMNVLRFISPYLQTAYTKRKKAHDVYLGKFYTVISLLGKVVNLLKKRE